MADIWAACSLKSLANPDALGLPESRAGAGAGAVTVVTVCFNSHGVLPDLLQSVPAGTDVILVDNASDKPPELRGLPAACRARVIGNSENLGFGRACNQGAALATTEFLFFLNPDTRLTPGCIERLCAAAREHPQASAFNPAIRKADGRPYFKRGSVLLPRAAWLPRCWPPGDREVPVLSGAALFVRRAAFLKVGGFDDEIFLYHEDDDLSLRLGDCCGPLRFVLDAEVTHAGGRSSNRSPRVAAIKAWHMGRSRVYATRKHKRPHAFGRALMQALLQVLSPVILVSARKRAKHLAFLKGVWSMRPKALRKAG